MRSPHGLRAGSLPAAPPPPTAPAASPPPRSPPSPTASTPAAAPPRPMPGLYRGETNQHRKITLRVGSGAQALTALKFGFGLRCTRHRPLSYVLTVAAPRWILTNGLILNRRFDDTGGARYRIAATFTAAGAVSGTLSISWRTSQYGNCRLARLAGRPQWSAEIVEWAWAVVPGPTRGAGRRLSAERLAAEEQQDAPGDPMGTPSA